MSGCWRTLWDLKECSSVLQNILAASSPLWVIIAFNQVYFQRRCTLLLQLLSPLATIEILYREYQFRNAPALVFPEWKEGLQPLKHNADHQGKLHWEPQLGFLPPFWIWSRPSRNPELKEGGFVSSVLIASLLPTEAEHNWAVCYRAQHSHSCCCGAIKMSIPSWCSNFLWPKHAFMMLT